MAESMRDILAREAAEAETVAEAEDRGERKAASGQRARRQASDPSQVYSVRIPVDRLEQLRRLAEQRGVAPTALMRQFVLERLDQETAPVQLAEVAPRDVHELRLGPSRSAELGDVIPLRASAQ
jgi:hypothetical protein